MPHPVVYSLRQSARLTAISALLAAGNAIRMTGLADAARGLGAIFMLHHVRPEPDLGFRPNAGLSVTPQTLDRTLKAVRAEGRDIIALEDVPARLRSGRSSRPFAVFTLDDGYRNNRDHAAPVFERHDAPFTVFVTKGFAERTHTMWWETAERLLNHTDLLEIDLGHGVETLPASTNAEKAFAFQRLSDAICGTREAEMINRLDAVARAHGIDPMAVVGELAMDDAELAAFAASGLARLGAHTVSHRGMASLTDHELDSEIAQSITHLESLTGHKPTTFAYPYGDARSVDARVVAKVQAAGLVAVTTRPGVVQQGEAAHADLPRVSLNGLFQKPWQVASLASGVPFRLMGK